MPQRHVLAMAICYCTVQRTTYSTVPYSCLTRLALLVLRSVTFRIALAFLFFLPSSRPPLVLKLSLLNIQTMSDDGSRGLWVSASPRSLLNLYRFLTAVDGLKTLTP